MDQVVEFLVGRDARRAGRFRLFHFAVAKEGPDFAVGCGDQAAVFEIAHEARLVDGIDRTQAHRHRWELPEVRHQPRVRIGRQARLFAQLMAEVLEMLIRQAAFEIGTRIDAGGGVALEIDQVARLIADRAAEKVVHAHFDQCCRRGEGRDMAADALVVFVGPHHHGDRIPPDQALDGAFQVAVAGIGQLLGNRDRVQVGRDGRQSGGNPLPRRFMRQPFQ